MKFVSLVSSGIDSPVATYLLSNKVDQMILVHGDNSPFTDDGEVEKFISIVNYLKDKIRISLKALVIPHGVTISSYNINCMDRFTCIFCKRMLVRYAEKIAKKEKAEAIVMGDSLGQVASQTLQNLHVVEQAVSIPILRPLIGFDKEDVIRIAKDIGTFNLSISSSFNCKAVPKKPATRAKLEQILLEEQKIDINELVNKAVNNSKLVSI